MDYIKTLYDYDFRNLNILECGSHQYGAETIGFRNNNNCYYIEANPTDYYIMITQPNIKSENVFNFALTDYCGEISFNITSHPGNSSINHSEDHKKELINIYHTSFKKINVPCITYTYFINNIIKNPIDLLVLDIEGHECVILNTMRSLSVEKLPKFLCIEAGYDWIDRKKILLELGYNIDFYNFNNVFLTHNTFNVNKNIDKIREINKCYPNFIWHNKLIFENDSQYQ